MIEKNGLGDPPEQEVEFNISAQVMLRIVRLTAKAEAAKLIMDQVMQAYKTLADVEQEKMDIEMSAICEAHSYTLPFPYEYKLDHERLTLSVKKKQSVGTFNA